MISLFFKIQMFARESYPMKFTLSFPFIYLSFYALQMDQNEKKKVLGISRLKMRMELVGEVNL